MYVSTNENDLISKRSSLQREIEHEHWHCDGESERQINIPKEEPMT